MIIEAKKDVKTVSAEELKSLNKVDESVQISVDEVPQNKETPAVVKEENKVEVKTEDNKNSEIKAEEVNTKTTDSKEEIKSTSSLLDRLIIEAKKDVKTVSAEELKSLNKVDESVQISVDEVPQNKETPAVVKEEIK
ncbi:MAG: hypothetical protein U5K55_10925 [Aliarcobacter sp.]|nr:hypothetical protein [Aliarcobacter sp.]